MISKLTHTEQARPQKSCYLYTIAQTPNRNLVGGIITKEGWILMYHEKYLAEIVTCPQFIELWIKFILVAFTCKLEQYVQAVDRQ